MGKFEKICRPGHTTAVSTGRVEQRVCLDRNGDKEFSSLSHKYKRVKELRAWFCQLALMRQVSPRDLYETKWLPCRDSVWDLSY
jgi:hypothetical protein